MNIKPKLINRQFIDDDVAYGVYIATTDDGKYIKNENGDFLSIFSTKNDRVAVNKLLITAKAMGFENPSYWFYPGARQISEEEYQEQVYRLKMGLTPDPLDVGANMDELEGKKLGY